jgi:hypothetical protein
MAIPTNDIRNNLLLSFRELVEAVRRGEDSTALQPKERRIIMLVDTMQRMIDMETERTKSLKAIEQLDIKNTLDTVGQLLALQLQLQENVVRDLREQLKQKDQLLESQKLMNNTINPFKHGVICHLTLSAQSKQKERVLTVHASGDDVRDKVSTWVHTRPSDDVWVVDKKPENSRWILKPVGEGKFCIQSCIKENDKNILSMHVTDADKKSDGGLWVHVRKTDCYVREKLVQHSLWQFIPVKHGKFQIMSCAENRFLFIQDTDKRDDDNFWVQAAKGSSQAMRNNPDNSRWSLNIVEMAVNR